MGDLRRGRERFQTMWPGGRADELYGFGARENHALADRDEEVNKDIFITSITGSSEVSENAKILKTIKLLTKRTRELWKRLKVMYDEDVLPIPEEFPKASLFYAFELNTSNEDSPITPRSAHRNNKHSPTTQGTTSALISLTNISEKLALSKTRRGSRGYIERSLAQIELDLYHFGVYSHGGMRTPSQGGRTSGVFSLSGSEIEGKLEDDSPEQDGVIRAMACKNIRLIYNILAILFHCHREMLYRVDPELLFHKGSSEEFLELPPLSAESDSVFLKILKGLYYLAYFYSLFDAQPLQFLQLLQSSGEAIFVNIREDSADEQNSNGNDKESEKVQSDETKRLLSKTSFPKGRPRERIDTIFSLNRGKSLRKPTYASSKMNQDFNVFDAQEYDSGSESGNEGIDQSNKQLLFWLKISEKSMFLNNIARWKSHINEWRWREENRNAAKGFWDELRRVQEDDKGRLFRVKLMIVGQGGVGKSATLRSLLGRDFIQDWHSTIGINVRHTKPISVLQTVNAALGDQKFIDSNGQSPWSLTDGGERVGYYSDISVSIALKQYALAQEAQARASSRQLKNSMNRSQHSIHSISSRNSRHSVRSNGSEGKRGRAGKRQSKERKMKAKLLKKATSILSGTSSPSRPAGGLSRKGSGFSVFSRDSMMSAGKSTRKAPRLKMKSQRRQRSMSVFSYGFGQLLNFQTGSKGSQEFVSKIGDNTDSGKRTQGIRKVKKRNNTAKSVKDMNARKSGRITQSMKKPTAPTPEKGKQLQKVRSLASMLSRQHSKGSGGSAPNLMDKYESDHSDASYHKNMTDMRLQMRPKALGGRSKKIEKTEIMRKFDSSAILGIESKDHVKSKLTRGKSSFNLKARSKLRSVSSLKGNGSSSFSGRNLSQRQISLISMNGKKKKPVQDFIGFSIWDYGGQEIFYTLHHLFLTRQGVYLIAFNCEDIEKNKDGYLETQRFLRFWLHSIALHAGDPPVVIVGTHSDSIAIAKSRFGKIQRCINEVVSEFKNSFSDSNKTTGMIVPNTSDDLIFFPIDNKTGEGLSALRANLLGLGLIQARRKFNIPIRWTMFLDKLQALKKPHVSLDKLKAAAQRSGIDSREIPSLLVYFHELGSLFYLNSTETLRNRVVVTPQWLIDKISLVIRDEFLHVKKVESNPEDGNIEVMEGRVDVEDMKKKGVYSEFRLLMSHGIASRDLLSYFWGVNELDFLIDAMRETLLMSSWQFKIPKVDGTDFSNGDDKYFLVPSLLKKQRVPAEVKSSQSEMSKLFRYMPSVSKRSTRRIGEVSPSQEAINAWEHYSSANPNMMAGRPQVQKRNTLSGSVFNTLKTKFSSQKFRTLMETPACCVFHFSFLPTGIFQRLMSLLVFYSGRENQALSSELKPPEVWFDRVCCDFQEKGRIDLYHLGDRDILCVFESHSTANVFVDVLQSMITKVNNDICHGSLSWKTFVRIGEKTFLPFDLAKQKNLFPWDTPSKKGRSLNERRMAELDIDAFLE